MSDAAQAERALLGGLLEDPTQLPALQVVLTRFDFGHPHHAALWSVLVSRQAAGLPIGVVELAGDVPAEQMKLMGGSVYVAQLPEYCPATANLGYYAEQVRSASMRRRIQRIGEQLRDDTGATPEELAERTVRELSSLTAPATSSVSLGDAWLAAEARRGTEQRWSTGFPSLDQLLDGGFAPEDVTVVGARPSMGKTALALAWLAHVGRTVPCGMVSLEMTTEKLAERLLSLVSCVPHAAIRTGDRAPDQAATLRAWHGRLPQVELWHEAGAPLSRVTGTIRHWWATRDVRLVVVDYLTLIREPPAYPGEPRPLIVGRVMQALKDLAVQLKLHVVVLSQLARASTERPPPRTGSNPNDPAWWRDVALPSSADLVWSSEVEAIADLIVFPLRAERMPGAIRQRNGGPSPGKGAAVLYVEKNRHGPTGFVPAQWHGPTVSYRPMDAPPVPT